MEVFDVLVRSGEDMSEEELINLVINGLGPGFDPVMALILDKLDSMGRES